MKRLAATALCAIAIAGPVSADETDCAIIQALRLHAAKHFRDIQLLPDRIANVKSSYKIDPNADCKIELPSESGASIICTLWFDRERASAKEVFEVFLASAVPCVALRRIVKRRPYLRGEQAELDDGQGRTLTLAYNEDSRYWYFELEYTDNGN